MEEEVGPDYSNVVGQDSLERFDSPMKKRKKRRKKRLEPNDNKPNVASSSSSTSESKNEPNKARFQPKKKIAPKKAVDASSGEKPKKQFKPKSNVQKRPQKERQGKVKLMMFKRKGIFKRKKQIHLNQRILLIKAKKPAFQKKNTNK